jgi:hypothetical protein
VSEQNCLNSFPDKDELLSHYNKNSNKNDLEVNAHFHTPYSFSAFDNIAQITNKAEEEKISVLGINDFNTVTGHKEFHDLCSQNKKFPLFNIEFMGLLQEEKEKGIKINDPTNPGRIYFSGKGLKYPCENKSEKVLEDLREICNKQTEEMIGKVNEHFVTSNVDINLDVNDIQKNYAKELVRERHIAKVIREKIYGLAKTKEEKLKLISKIYEGHSEAIDFENISAMENEIRSKLLKKGGVAFVEEDPKSFLPVEALVEWIVNAGGIPCYPVLLDDSKGNFTDFEKDYSELLANLKKYSIPSLELIPVRNKIHYVKEFVEFFNKNGIIVLLGTEHNTPEMIPLKVACSDSPLNDELKKISYEGAAIVAAHQYKIAKGELGLLAEGMPSKQKLEEFTALGKSVIEYYLK